jgi:anti-sigma regulatory factor (Ser/Thr protein kinase)
VTLISSTAVMIVQPPERVSSAAVTPLLRQRLPATVQSVPEARHTALAALREAGYADPEMLDDVALALSEAVGNVARHAYPGRDGEVEVEVAVDGEGIIVVVADQGDGMSLPSETPGLGLGLQLIRAKTRDWNVESDGTGTRLTMQFG